MTLRELYDEAKKKPTPAIAFVQEVMQVTKKSEISVRRWISGEVLPDALTQDVLANHFKSTPEELFGKV